MGKQDNDSSLVKGLDMSLRDHGYQSTNDRMKIIVRMEPSWIANQELAKKQYRIQVAWRLFIIAAITLLIWLNFK